MLSNDELDTLSLAFSRFLDKLQPLIKAVAPVTAEVESALHNLVGMAAVNVRLIGGEHPAVDQSVPPPPK